MYLDDKYQYFLFLKNQIQYFKIICSIIDIQ